jgi:hypothetical protein
MAKKELQNTLFALKFEDEDLKAMTSSRASEILHLKYTLFREQFGCPALSNLNHARKRRSVVNISRIPLIDRGDFTHGCRAAVREHVSDSTAAGERAR